MMTWIYACIAIAFLVIVFVLISRTNTKKRAEDFPEPDEGRSLGDVRWLDLSERIFDPSDAYWLRKELAFPKLADSLTLARKQLAIRWLETLQASFDEFVSTPRPISNETIEDHAISGWKMLWLTLRFQFLISYALFIVQIFGPYHRLIPSFSWVPFQQGIGSRLRRPAFVHSRTSHS